MEDTRPLEEVAADIHALMAGDAADRLEQLIALLLVVREGLPVSAEPTIEAACRREQRSLIGRDRIEHAVAVRHMSVGAAEPTHHFRIRSQPAKDLIDARCHGARIGERSLSLRLEGAKPPLPAEPEAERGVEDRAGIEWKLHSVGTCVAPIAVRSVAARVMTRRAGTRTVVRETAVLEQALSQSQLRWRRRGRLGNRRDRLMVGHRECGPRWSGGRIPNGSPDKDR